jgi:hypothetical protein
MIFIVKRKHLIVQVTSDSKEESLVWFNKMFGSPEVTLEEIKEESE